MYFDGSDVGLATLDVDAFAPLSDGSFLFSFTTEGNVGTLGLVDDSDIVRFVPTSIGPVTAGTFEWYFDGSDVELDTDAEDIDGLAVLNDGRLLISTSGNPVVTGIDGRDEDLLAFTPSQLGATTSGTWSLYFNGRKVGLNTTSSEDINGVWVDSTTNDIYLSALGTFSVTNVSGDGSDVFICSPLSLGVNTSCNFRSYWVGSANGFAGEIVDALSIDLGANRISSAQVEALHEIEHTGEGDDPLADPNEGADDVDSDQQFFLPQLRR
jgi:hypothetical protein